MTKFSREEKKMEPEKYLGIRIELDLSDIILNSKKMELHFYISEKHFLT